MSYQAFRKLAANLVLGLLIVISSVSGAVDKAEFRRVLTKLGFEDQAAELTEALNRRNFLNPQISPKVLKFQAQRFNMYNDVREIAVDILGTLNTTNFSEEARSKIITLITKLVTTKPLRPPTNFPAHIENAASDEAEALKLKYAIEVTRQNIERQTEIIMTDIVGTMFGQNHIERVTEKMEKDGVESLDEKDRADLVQLKEIEQRLARVVQFMYLDGEMGSFSVTAIGKALILGLAAHEGEMIKPLRKALNKVGMHYENYVGTKLKVADRDGKIQDITIENGDFVMERSVGREASEITSAARPGLFNYIRALRLGLVGSIGGALIIPDAEKKADGGAGWITNMRKYVGDLYAMRKGISHIGMAEVLEDPVTRIRTTRTLDNYPDAGEGGIRVTDFLHQFAKNGEFMRLAVTRLNAEKYAEFEAAYVKQHGYKDSVWLAHQYGKDGKVAKENSVPWSSAISRQQYEARNSAILSPKERLKDANERLVAEMHNLKRGGMAFAYGFKNELGRGYCTFTLILAGLRALQVDLQPVADRWHLMVRAMNRMGIGGASDMRMQDRIMAPGGISWQTNLVDLDGNQIVNYRDIQESERMETLFQNHDSSLYPDLHRGFRRISHFIDLAQTGNIDDEGDMHARIQGAIEGNRAKTGKMERGRLVHDNRRAGYIGHVTDALTGTRRKAFDFLWNRAEDCQTLLTE